MNACFLKYRSMKKESTYERAVQELDTFYRYRRRMPSFGELAALLGLRSKNGVYKLVAKLEENGVVEKDRTGRLIPPLPRDDLRVLGAVEAGFPSEAEEQLLDTVSLDDWLIENKEASFLLRVTGESMRGAGIRSGDMVIVERGRAPEPGDIVIAEVDRQWTMKYYCRSGERVWLEPAHPDYSPIYPREELRVAAVVRAVVRKY